MNIASLLPCATEMVFALGLGDELVGVSHECDFPALVKQLPVLTKANVDYTRRGRLIDADVRTRLRQGLSMYELDIETLRSLSPDVILTQDQCEVCAVSLSEVEETMCRIIEKKIKVISLSPHRLEEIFGDILRLGGMLGAPSPAATLLGSLRARLSALSDFQVQPVPRVLCMEWFEPPMIGGGWIPELVRLAGGEPLIVTEPIRFRETGWEEVLASDPDIFCLFPCGYPVAKTLREISTSRETLFLKKLRAVQNGNAYILDGNAYFNRPGPRIVDSAEILLGVLQPSARHFRAHYASAIAKICL